MPEDVLRHRSEHEPLDPGEPMAAQDEQIGSHLLRFAENFLPDVDSFANVNRHVRGARCVGDEVGHLPFQGGAVHVGQRHWRHVAAGSKRRRSCIHHRDLPEHVQHGDLRLVPACDRQRMLQGQVVLANFANAQGLRNETGTAWSETADSGQALLGVPGVGSFGALAASTLEGSNVDLTQQLVNLMEGQRNYQANSKVLTTNKELTQVLFNAI